MPHALSTSLLRSAQERQAAFFFEDFGKRVEPGRSSSSGKPAAAHSDIAEFQWLKNWRSSGSALIASRSGCIFQSVRLCAGRRSPMFLDSSQPPRLKYLHGTKGCTRPFASAEHERNEVKGRGAFGRSVL